MPDPTVCHGDVAPLTGHDITRLRGDTPSSAAMIHLDNAGASPAPDPVHRRVVAHLAREREIGGYAAEREVRGELERFYDSIAGLIGAERDEIAFAESATRAWNMAFYAIAFRPGDRILTSKAEYASNYMAFLHVAQQHGVEIGIIPDDENGTIDIDALKTQLDDRVKLVNLCHAPTSNGLCNDAAAVGAVLRDHPAVYILDACQTIGQIDIDVAEIGCDILSGTGRKFLRGPRGTGLLYVRKSLLHDLRPPFIDIRAADWTARDDFSLRPDARRFESWESSVAGRLGLKAAADYARTIGIAAIQQRIARLAEQLRAMLSRIPGIRIQDRGVVRTGIVTMSVANADVGAVQQALMHEGVAVSALRRDDNRLDLGADCPGVLRASVHYFNTEDELARFADTLAAILGRAV